MKPTTGNKFLEDRFLKSKGDCCDFIKILKCISDNGQTAEVVVIWYTQDVRGYRAMSYEMQLKITQKQYPLWRAINPRGPLYEL